MALYRTPGAPKRTDKLVLYNPIRDIIVEFAKKKREEKNSRRNLSTAECSKLIHEHLRLVKSLLLFTENGILLPNKLGRLAVYTFEASENTTIINYGLMKKLAKEGKIEEGTILYHDSYDNKYTKIVWNYGATNMDDTKPRFENSELMVYQSNRVLRKDVYAIHKNKEFNYLTYIR